MSDKTEKKGGAPSPLEWLHGVGTEGRLIDHGEIGRGGMGSVHRMRDEVLRRDVAVKTLSAKLRTRPSRVAHFVQEAQIAGQLEHPNIAPVHELAIDEDGHPYLVMKLVRGVSFWDWLEDPSRPAGSPERLADGLEIFMKVCDAISFAHSRGVLHRDIKPPNIMVGEFGEVYVMDWGLARVLDSSQVDIVGVDGGASDEAAGAVGTAEYMAPEQAVGGAHCDHRADVFGLGAVLYQIVTGYPPYVAERGTSLMRAVREGDYRRPEEVLSGIVVSKRLLQIVKKALAKDPSDRHPSAAELKRDVQRFLGSGLHLPRVACDRGTRIVIQGEIGDEAYVIVKGQCVAYKVVDGQKIVLRTMSAGDVFGEMAVVSQSPRSATVEAVTQVTLLAITRPVLEEGIGMDTWVGGLIRALVDRFRELDERVHGSSDRSAERNPLATTPDEGATRRVSWPPPRLAEPEQERETIQSLIADLRERAGRGSDGVEEDYEDLGEIARGGMGQIRRVVHKRLRCELAMKTFDRELAKNEVLLDGFVEEAQITSQLDHPSIVPIHDLAADQDGNIFFTMKYVRGKSWYDLLAHKSRSVGSPERLLEGLDIFLKVCDAVSFAHSRGVIHRDLKPDNIMVGDFGEVYLMDWGLARLVGPAVRTSRHPLDASSRAREGAVGTPAYMSPEAAMGLIELADERTDVFGLGTILYQIVTGKTPYRGNGVKEVLELAKRGEYEPPSEAMEGIGVSKKILRIIERAMAPERGARHPSAAALKDDVQRFLRGGSYLPRTAFPPGTKIVTEGEAGDTAYVIVKGTCEAYKTEGGERRVLRQMGPGDVFGETAVLSDLPRTATVEAIDKVTALIVDRAALEEGIGLDTWMGNLVRALAMRFRDIDARLSQHEASRQD